MPAPSPSRRSVIDGFEAIALRPAQIHAQQHLGPILAFGAARSGMNGHDGAFRIVLARQQHLGLQLFQVRREMLHLALQIGGDVFAFARELEQRVQIRSQAARSSSSWAIGSSSRLRSCMIFWLFRAGSRNRER